MSQTTLVLSLAALFALSGCSSDSSNDADTPDTAMTADTSDDVADTGEDVEEDTLEPDVEEDTLEPDVEEDTLEPDVEEDTLEPDVEEDTIEPDVEEDTTPEPCTYTGYEAVAEDFGHISAWGLYVYLAQDTTTAGEPVDVLKIELVEPDGPTGPGSYAITTDGYDTCTQCVTIQMDCNDSLEACSAAFIAQSGTLEITSFGEAGGQFTGTLTDVVLHEAVIADDLTTTLVDGGATWCLPSYAFDALVQ